MREVVWKEGTLTDLHRRASVASQDRKASQIRSGYWAPKEEGLRRKVEGASEGMSWGTQEEDNLLGDMLANEDGRAK
jgi:hypothetical protein